MTKLTKNAIINAISAKITGDARKLIEENLVKLYEENIDDFNGENEVDEISAVFYTKDFLDYIDEEEREYYFDGENFNGDNFRERMGGVIFGKTENGFTLYYDGFSVYPAITTIEEFTEKNAKTFNRYNDADFRKLYEKILEAVINS